MDPLIAVLACGLILLVIVLVGAPLRAARSREDPGASQRAELAAAREAKYREIRDCELDYRTGKLSRGDYEAIDGTLRAEALAILNRLEDLQAG